jgi:hypothetical protein
MREKIKGSILELNLIICNDDIHLKLAIMDLKLAILTNQIP